MFGFLGNFRFPRNLQVGLCLVFNFDLSGYPFSLLQSRNTCSVLFAISKYNFFCFYIHLFFGVWSWVSFRIHILIAKRVLVDRFSTDRFFSAFCRDTCLMVLCLNSFLEPWAMSMINNSILILDPENYTGVGTINAWEPCKLVLFVLMCLHEG